MQITQITKRAAKQAEQLAMPHRCKLAQLLSGPVRPEFIKPIKHSAGCRLFRIKFSKDYRAAFLHRADESCLVQVFHRSDLDGFVSRFRGVVSDTLIPIEESDLMKKHKPDAEESAATNGTGHGIAALAASVEAVAETDKAVLIAWAMSSAFDEQAGPRLETFQRQLEVLAGRVDGSEHKLEEIAVTIAGLGPSLEAARAELKRSDARTEERVGRATRSAQARMDALDARMQALADQHREIDDRTARQFEEIERSARAMASALDHHRDHLAAVGAGLKSLGATVSGSDDALRDLRGRVEGEFSERIAALSEELRASKAEMGETLEAVRGRIEHVCSRQLAAMAEEHGRLVATSAATSARLAGLEERERQRSCRSWPRRIGRVLGRVRAAIPAARAYLARP